MIRLARSVVATNTTGHQWIAVVLVIALLGAILRFYVIDIHPFWYDEVVASGLAANPYLALLSGAARDNGNPPLFWVTAHFITQIFGSSETVFRSISVVSAILTILMIAYLGRQLFNPAVGCVAALLFAFNPFSVELSVDTRAYALLQLLIVANMALFALWLRNGRSAHLVLYGVTLAMAVLCHYYAIAIPIAQGVTVIATQRNRFGPWLAAAMAAALGSLFWLPSFLDQLGEPGNALRLSTSSYVQFMATPLVYGVGKGLVWRDQGWYMLGIWSVVCVLVFWLPALAGLQQTWRSGARRTSVLMASWLGIPLAVLPLLFNTVIGSIYHTRAGSVALPALVLLMAGGLHGMTPRWRAAFGLGIVVLTVAGLHGFMTKPMRPDWPSAAPALIAQRETGEALVFYPDFIGDVFCYHVEKKEGLGRAYGIRSIPRGWDDPRAGTLFESCAAVEANSVEVLDEIRQAESLWLVVGLSGFADRPEAWFADGGYTVERAQSFYGVEIYRLRRGGSE